MRSSYLGQPHARVLENICLRTPRQIATTSPSRSALSLVVYAGPAGRIRRTGPGSGKGPTPKPGVPKRPESGYFADTDPNGKIRP